MSTTRQTVIAQVLLLAVGYFFAAKAGLLLAFVHGSVTTVWPASGIALAAVLHFGWRILPGVALGAFAANIAATGVPVLTALGIALGNSLEAAAGVFLLRRLAHFSPALERMRDLLALILFGALLNSVLGATVGSTSLYLSGLLTAENYWRVWNVWLAGDAMGILIVAPVILCWLERPLPAYEREQWLELTALFLLLWVLGIYVLPGDGGAGQLALPFPQLLFPPLIWIAIRFGVREAATALLFVAGVAIWETSIGIGPFARESLVQSLVFMHGFLVVLAFTTLLLAASNEERKHAWERLRLASNAIESTADGVMITDSQCHIVSVNKAFSAITGYRADEVLGRTPSILQSGRHDAEFYQGMWRELARTGHWQGEIWNRRKDGAAYPEWLAISEVRDRWGKPSHYVAVFTDISLRKESEQRLDFLAHHDALTQLANRTLFHDWLQETLLRARRHDSRVGLLFIDLDHFKPINDTLGHLVGDHLLQEVAKRISACVRESDMIARLGGDEFTVLLDDLADREDAAGTARKILATLSEPFHISGHELQISASIGIACYPHDGQDAETLLRNADTAMYRAKEGGRNDYRFYSGD